jgi:HEAT repeat protein
MITLVLMLALLQADPPPAKDKSVADALEKFKKAYKAKDAADRAIAAQELAKTPHEKTYAMLAKLLVVDDLTVRIAAAKGLSTADGDQRRKNINFLSKAFPANAGEPLVSAALVESMETMQEGLGYAVCKANLKSPDPNTSRAAIEAMGQIRDKSFVGPLIDHARFLEAAAREALNVGPNGKTVTGGGLPYVGGTAGDPDAPKRAKVLVPLLHKALESITKQSFKTPAEWQEWWKRHEEDFKVPK